MIRSVLSCIIIWFSIAGEEEGHTHPKVGWRVGSHDGSLWFKPVLSVTACGEPINRRLIGSHMVRAYAPPICGCGVCALA